LFSLFAGEYVTQHPATLGGKLAVLMIMFSGLGFFAVLTGTVSAIMIEKLKEGAVLRRMSLDDLEGHILVCGWNSGVETLLKEIQDTPRFRDKDVVVICSREELPELTSLADPRGIRHLRDDFTRAEVLSKARVSTAEVAVLVSDLSEGRTRQDADARTVLAALTIEKLNPHVYTCAELSNAMNEAHLRMGKVDQVIITRELAGRMLAQAAMHSGAMVVLKDLLRSSAGSHLVNLAVEGDLVGLEFADCLATVRKKHGLVPLAVERPGHDVRINPDGLRLQQGDSLICVSGAGG
jgi:voltage-gated potassium channel